MYLIIKFWQACLARGDIPPPVYVTISIGGQQPLGYIMGWSINKRAQEKAASKLEGFYTTAKLTYDPRSVALT